MVKGIKFVIYNFVGVREIYFLELIWIIVDEVIEMILFEDYDFVKYRVFIELNYFFE